MTQGKVKLATYNPETGVFTGIHEVRPDLVNDPFVLLPDDFTSEHIEDHAVDLETLEIIPNKRKVPADEVNAERDDRIGSGFKFNGVVYDFDPDSVTNITGAGSSAGVAMAMGAIEGDFRWAGTDHDFFWIARDNSQVLMDAHTMFAMSQAAMRHKEGHIQAARFLKDLPDLPTDWKDDKYWPARAIL